jgi:hypothetical protein
MKKWRARKKKLCPYDCPRLPESLVWLLRSVPEDPKDRLLEVVPKVVEPSEKGRWKELLWLVLLDELLRAPWKGLLDCALWVRV